MIDGNAFAISRSTVYGSNVECRDVTGRDPYIRPCCHAFSFFVVIATNSIFQVIYQYLFFLLNLVDPDMVLAIKD